MIRIMTVRSKWAHSGEPTLAEPTSGEVDFAVTTQEACAREMGVIVLSHLREAHMTGQEVRTTELRLELTFEDKPE